MLDNLPWHYMQQVILHFEVILANSIEYIMILK